MFPGTGNTQLETKSKYKNIQMISTIYLRSSINVHIMLTFTLQRQSHEHNRNYLCFYRNVRVTLFLECSSIKTGTIVIYASLTI